MRPLSRGGDFWSGLVLAALGAYIVSEARGWTYMSEDGPGPGFFPMWYGSIMVVLALILVLRSVLTARMREAPRVHWPDLARALTCWGAFVGCIALMRVLGFTVALALLTWFIVAVMARRPQREAIVIAIAGSALFYGVFAYLLELSLPRGLLF